MLVDSTCIRGGGGENYTLEMIVRHRLWGSLQEVVESRCTWIVTDHGDLDQKAYRTRPHLLATLIGTHCYYWEPDESSQSVFVSLGPSADLGCNQWLLRFLLHFYSPTQQVGPFSPQLHWGTWSSTQQFSATFYFSSLWNTFSYDILYSEPQQVAFNTSVLSKCIQWLPYDLLISNLKKKRCTL